MTQYGTEEQQAALIREQKRNDVSETYVTYDGAHKIKAARFVTEAGTDAVDTAQKIMRWMNSYVGHDSTDTGHRPRFINDQLALAFKGRDKAYIAEDGDWLIYDSDGFFSSMSHASFLDRYAKAT